MGVAQTLVQIFTWSTKIICDKTVLSVMKYMQNCHRKCTMIDKSTEFLEKNGLTIIQNCHCNKKLKIYLNLQCIWKIWWPLQERFVLVPKTQDFFQIIWECWHKEGCNYTIWQKWLQWQSKVAIVESAFHFIVTAQFLMYFFCVSFACFREINRAAGKFVPGSSDFDKTDIGQWVLPCSKIIDCSPLEK